MSRNEVEILRAELYALSERVTKLETYVKAVGAFMAIVPTALQIYVLFFRK